ncbi:hypothetical protein HX823_07060 [Pseudomonas sp. P7759]|uniref:GDSL-type esterase/lipase family protein n=1 Tax=Pseudomonas sp. P7759 TaxID=2738831 RepID=UPI00159FC655|nr:GDSL-type esterase/lipase family protein [Pseudomonas sp. P7759]NWC73839.1 hypothetical protein [Pseudomonas sp. P7759]
MELKNFFAQDDAGNALPNATCYLYKRGTETLVTGLKNATGGNLANPFPAAGDGRVEFAAADGLYDLRVVSGARDNRIHIQCLDVSNTIARVLAEPIPKDAPFNARGDGVTDDTAAFAAFELVNKARRVDLGGAVYVVAAVPSKNAYVNGAFKVGGFTQAVTMNDPLSPQQPRFHKNGGQLAALKNSLTNPLEQLTSIVIIGDSIVWGSGNAGEQAPTDPRNGTLADPRDYFGTPSWVNQVKRYIGANYAAGALPVLTNWPASPSGESIVEYSVVRDLFPRGGSFTTKSVGVSLSITDVANLSGITGFQRQLSDGNLAQTSYHSISFPFTGTSFTLYFGVSGDGLDYELFVDGITLGVYTTSEGEDGLTFGNNRTRTHTFSYIRNKQVELRTKRRVSQTSGTKIFRVEGIRVNKKIRISNQGINGASTRTYKANNLPGNPYAHGSAVGPQDNYVLCQLGTNDRIKSALFPQGVNEFSANLSALLDVLQPMTSVILMCANPATNESSDVYSFTMQDVRGEIYRQARTRSLDMIDNYTALSIADMSLITNDGLHPNPLGYTLMARNVINSLESS